MISTLEELEFQVLHFGVMGMVSTLEETLFEFKFCNLRAIDLLLSSTEQFSTAHKQCSELHASCNSSLLMKKKTLKDFFVPLVHMN